MVIKMAIVKIDEIDCIKTANAAPKQPAVALKDL